jgi:Uncharacterised nucleotidyltransferase
MTRGTGGLETLTRHERDALRKLLIRATSVAGCSKEFDELSPLTAAAPITALPAAAALHRVSGTVLRGLDGVDGVPCEVREQLAAVRRQASLHHLLVVGALGQITRSFDEAGLSWVAMKGPVVAALLYPDVGDRSYADLDLLVDRLDFPRAMQILEDLGYHHSIHNWALAEAMLAGQVGLQSPALHVDLHWHLHYSREDRRPFAIHPELMIGRANRVVVSGLTVPAFDPVDRLLTLAFHAARSGGHRLIWLKDIQRAVSVEDPDLDELVARCHRFRCGPPVGIMLGRAKALLDAEIPDEIVRAITPAALRVPERFNDRHLRPVRFHERDTVTRFLTRSAKSSTATSVAAVPTRVVRQLRRNLFPPPTNETDSREEKARYLQAVTASVEP